MHIPFGVTRLNQIGEQTTSVILKKLLFQKYKITIDKIKSTVVRFPHEAEILKNHFYYWVPGTGYKRFFLWITNISDVNMVILINLDNKKIYQVSIRVNDNIFEKEFILSGEIIHTDSANYFMAEDIIAFNDIQSNNNENNDPYKTPATQNRKLPPKTPRPLIFRAWRVRLQHLRHEQFVDQKRVFRGLGSA